MDIVVVRILIEDSYGKRRFNGTAFFVDNYTLITAKHVVASSINKGYKIYLSDIPDGGNLLVPLDDIELCKRDIAVISVKREFNISVLGFTDELKVESQVKLIGYHNEDGAINFYDQNISGYTNTEHTYEIQDARTNGLSGSPVILDGKVCGIAQAISSKKGVTYIIPISECSLPIIQNKIEKKNPYSRYDEDMYIAKMLDNSHFRIILSRRYSKISSYEKKVEAVFSQQDFNIKTLRIQKYDFNILDELAKLFDISDKKSIESKLYNKLKESNKYLLVIKNFEDIDNSVKERFASLLRSLIEDTDNFYLIIFGGKKLAQLAYENGNTSLFSNANALFNEDSSFLSKAIEEVTGGHPKLNELCREMKKNESVNYYKEQLSISATLSMIFIHYHDIEKLCRYFKRKSFGLYSPWNKDELIRELFWANLLKREKNTLVWRSEFIQQVGKGLKCET